MLDHNELWAIQFLRIKLQQKWKEANGKYSGQRLSKKDKKAFDEMLDYSRLYNSAGSNACRPQLIHPIKININSRIVRIFSKSTKTPKAKANPMIKNASNDQTKKKQNTSYTTIQHKTPFFN